MAIVAINTSLRIADIMNFRWGRRRDENVEMLSFGHTFFTSLWVLSVIGSSIAFSSGRAPDSITNTKYTWDLTSGAIWGVVFIFTIIIIPLCTEYLLANHVEIDEEMIDFEYTIDAMKEMIRDE
jgi:hypothetical protein